MKRWNSHARDMVEDPAIDEFLAEIVDVCKRHGMSISHEDNHGAFIVESFSDRNASWLLHAHSVSARR